MKKLLINAIEGLMEVIDNQIDVMEQDIRNVKTLNQRINILNDRRITVINEIAKLNYLNEQLDVRFQEENETINNFIQKVYNRLDDMAFIVHDMKNVIEIDC